MRTGMLRADPDHRLTANEVVEHPWFKDDGGGEGGSPPPPTAACRVTGGLRELGAKKRLTVRP